MSKITLVVQYEGKQGESFRYKERFSRATTFGEVVARIEGLPPGHYQLRSLSGETLGEAETLGEREIRNGERLQLVWVDKVRPGSTPERFPFGFFLRRRRLSGALAGAFIFVALYAWGKSQVPPEPDFRTEVENLLAQNGRRNPDLSHSEGETQEEPQAPAEEARAPREIEPPEAWEEKPLPFLEVSRSPQAPEDAPSTTPEERKEASEETELVSTIPTSEEGLPAKTSPFSSKEWYEEGLKAFQEGDLEAAETAFLNAWRLNKQWPDPLEMLVEVGLPESKKLAEQALQILQKKEEKV